jgi:hypothetical protein
VYYEYGVITAAPASGAPYWDMLAGTSDALLRELHVFTTAGTTNPWGLFRSTAAGTRTTPTVPTNPANALIAAGNAPLTGFATAWSVNPTLAATALRRFQGAASIGAGVIWTWYGPGGGLRIPSGGSIVLSAVGAVGVATAVTAIWEE